MNETHSEGLAFSILKCIQQYWKVAWPVGTLLGGYFVFTFVLEYAGRLSETEYSEAIIVVEVAKRLGVIWVPGFLAFVTLFIRTEYDFCWSSVSESSYLRGFITILVALMAWNYSTYDCNLYFGKWHLVDRVLLLLCVPLVFYFPAVVFPFLVVLAGVMGQFRHPDFLPQLWPEKLLIFRVLVLFGAYYFLVGVTRIKRLPFLFVLFVFVAAHYWPSGFSKLQMGWLLNNELSNMAFSAYANGWQPWLSENAVVERAQSLSRVDFPMRLFTLMAELSVIFLVWPRTRSDRILDSRETDGESNNNNCAVPGRWEAWRPMLILTMLAALHVGIWTTSGICFLNWIVFDLALVAVMYGMLPMRNPGLVFTRCHQVIFLMLVFTGPYWLENTKFSWFETRVCYTYRLSAVAEDGNEYPISPELLAPYDFAFTWNLFGYIYPGKQLPIRYGNAREKYIGLAVNRIQSVDELLQLETELGTVRYDAERKERFKKFLQVFFQNLNRQGKISWLDYIQRPADIISSPRRNAFNAEANVRTVRVSRVTTLFDGQTFQAVRTEHLFDVEIPTNQLSSEQLARPR